MLALSIRQPYAELILRGIKTIEYRSRATKIIGERFWIYASKKSVVSGPLSVVKTNAIWSGDLQAKSPPAWLVELAGQVGMIEDLRSATDAQLPMGVIVGSAVIERVTPIDEWFQWHLVDVERAVICRKPKRHPQPVWFKPF